MQRPTLGRRPFAPPLLLAFLVGFAGAQPGSAPARPGREVTLVPGDSLRVTASVGDKPRVGPDEPIKLALSRPLQRRERLAVVIGANFDVSGLCRRDESGDLFTCRPGAARWPLGEAELTVYLVDKKQEWLELARFPFSVVKKEPLLETSKITTTLDVALKVQHDDRRYPDDDIVPVRRRRFQEGELRFRLETDHGTPNYGVDSEWDVAGFTFKSDAVAFARREGRAPKIDLASYRIRARVHESEVTAGNVNIGRHRLLIDEFNSRGVLVKLPLLDERVEFSYGAANGQSFAGADNFFGLAQKRNQVQAWSAGVNLLREHGRLRVEYTGFDGAVLAADGLNQQSLNDPERSWGWGLRVTGNDPWERLEFDIGRARSLFSNPRDPLLDQESVLVPLNDVERVAQYANLKLKIFELLKLEYNHERAEPEYKSIGASSVRPDFFENRYGASGELRGCEYRLSLSRSHDNLNEIRSIIQTETRQASGELTVRTATLLGAKRLTPLYPTLKYSHERVHQLGVFAPVNTIDEGSPPEEALVPNQLSRNHDWGVDWDLQSWGSLGMSYSFSSIDNQQLGRESADSWAANRKLRVSLKPHKSLDFNGEVGNSRNFNIETAALNRTTSFNLGGEWRPLLKTTISGSYSVSLQNDDPLTSENKTSTGAARIARDLEFGKRFRGQIFFNYNETASRTIDHIALTVTHNNSWVLSSGVSFNFQ